LQLIAYPYTAQWCQLVFAPRLTAGANRKQEKVMSTLHETILEQTAIISALIIAAMPTIAAIASMF
jgi:hypothetical protein